jgi:hypothetical protein
MRPHLAESHRHLGVAAALVALTACIPGPPPAIVPSYLPLQDSSAIAFETGRRDAHLLHPVHYSSAPLFAAPVGMVAFAATRQVLALPLSILAGSTVSIAQAFRAAREPIPAPPDSMRRRYGQLSPEQWDSYVRGFKSEIQTRRDDAYRRSKQSGVFSVALQVPLLFLPRPRSAPEHLTATP